MGSASNYAENKILDHIVGKTSYTMPTTYIALSTASITDSTTGTTITEPSGGSYARVATSGLWGAASGGSITNSGGAIAFATATGSWGLVTDWAIIDASTVGNIIAYGTLTASKTVDSGDTVSFASSALTINLD